MKPFKDDKQSSTPQAPATETTTEEGSGLGTSAATTSTAETPPHTPGPAMESVVSMTTSSSSTTASRATRRNIGTGISMVQGPPISVGSLPPMTLAPEPSTSRGPTPSAAGSLTYSEIVTNLGPVANAAGLTRAAGSSAYRTQTQAPSGRPSTVHNQIDHSTSPLTSMYSLDREIQKYLKQKDSTYDFYPRTERSVYDYISERTNKYSTNLLESTAHLLKGSLGAGILSMHEAYMIGGLWTSLAVTIVIGVLLGYTMFMLIRSAQKMYRRLRIKKLSYPDLAEAAAATAPWIWVRKFSKTFRYIVEISIFLEMCGTCCLYQIINAYSIKQIVEGFDSDASHWLFDIRMYILITAPLLIPLCLIRSFKLMAPFSVLADVFVAICVMTTLYYSLHAYDVNIAERAAWKDMHGFIWISGLCMYGTSGICVALPVENHMRAPQHFPRAVRYATSTVILFSVMIGVFGYWAWGEKCKSPITIHMPLNEATTVLRFMLVMMLSITFAVQFWVLFHIVWHYIARRHKRKQAIWETVYRVLMAILVMGASMVYPDMIPVMILLGQFFLGFIALIFPAFIEFLVDWEEDYANRTRVRFCNNTKNFGLVLLGLSLSLPTIYSMRG